MGDSSTFVALFRDKRPADFDAWAAAAQPGARTLYGVGFNAVQAAPAGVAARMRELADHGLVVLAQQRRAAGDGGGLDYVAVRTQRVVPAGFPALRDLNAAVSGLHVRAKKAAVS